MKECVRISEVIIKLESSMAQPSHSLAGFHSTFLRGCIRVEGSGLSACKKIGWPDANKMLYRYQFRKDRTTGIHNKMLLFTLAASR